jgi:hypothetical protein
MTDHVRQCQDAKLVVLDTSKWLRIVSVFLSLFLLLPFITAPVFAADNPKIQAAMLSLKDSTAKLGAPKLDGEDLYFGTTKANGDFAIVDEIKAKHEATATIFAKKGTNFVRISTNVMKEGQRAVGSVLDPSGPAYAAIKQGNAFYGLVDILGKTYDTGYEPIKSASGEVIGILYVGYLME